MNYCGIVSYCSRTASRSWFMLVGGCARAKTRLLSSPHSCSIGDMPGDIAAQSNTVSVFWAINLCVTIVVCGLAPFCCRIAEFWGESCYACREVQHKPALRLHALARSQCDHTQQAASCCNMLLFLRNGLNQHPNGCTIDTGLSVTLTSTPPYTLASIISASVHSRPILKQNTTPRLSGKHNVRSRPAKHSRVRCCERREAFSVLWHRIPADRSLLLTVLGVYATSESIN